MTLFASLEDKALPKGGLLLALLHSDRSQVKLVYNFGLFECNYSVKEQILSYKSYRISSDIRQIIFLPKQSQISRSVL